MATVRFSNIVTRCGDPVAHTQWVPVKKDTELLSAIKNNRIMTVHIQTVGTKRDYGEIGYVDGGQRTLLIFPKSLRTFEGKRVVGIDYGLLRRKRDVAKASSKTAHKPDLVLFKKAPPKPVEKPAPKSFPDAKRERVSSEKVRQKQPAAKKADSSPSAEKEIKSVEVIKRLHQAIKKAMRQLGQGKDVAAYQTLENCL